MARITDLPGIHRKDLDMPALLGRSIGLNPVRLTASGSRATKSDFSIRELAGNNRLAQLLRQCRTFKLRLANEIHANSTKFTLVRSPGCGSMAGEILLFARQFFTLRIFFGSRFGLKGCRRSVRYPCPCALLWGALTIGNVGRQSPPKGCLNETSGWRLTLTDWSGFPWKLKCG